MNERAHAHLVEALDRLPKDPAGNPLVSEVAFRGRTLPFDASGWAAYKHASSEEVRGEYLGRIRGHAAHVAKILIKKEWTVVFVERPAFITTDAPVASMNAERGTFGLGTPGTLVAFPLSPTRVLLIGEGLRHPGRYCPLADPSGPALLNLAAWLSCERFMISPRHPGEVFAEMAEFESWLRDPVQ